MYIFYHDHFVLPLPDVHRFPMDKYRRLRDRVAAAGWPQARLLTPEGATDGEITRVHAPEYWERVQNGRLAPAEIRRLGFPWSPQLVERARRSAGSTLAACRAALRDGAAVNLAGGTHHAHYDWGQGYCVLNDSVIAARAMQAEGRARRVVILDCDVHQGNGTASITQEDPSIFTFSLHGARNFPFHKAASNLDVALPDRANDELYLDALEQSLWRVLMQARADLAIYLAGADPFVEDRLGRLAVSKAGLAQRDAMVLEVCRRAGLPVAVTMAGGYARQVEDIVDIHFQTVALTLQHTLT